jgi:DNA-binding Lrp family transcriptional regulator
MGEEMINLYNSGKSFREISEILNIPTTTVWRKLKNKVEIKKHSFYGEKLRKYKINENFFQKIDTREKAYILGLLLADGHRCKNVKQIRLKLQEQDKQILEQIKLVMDYDKPLNYEKRKEESHQNTYSLIICNSKICDDLEKHGIVKNKTFDIKIPIISDELFMDMFRGYFDGDGWFSCDDNNKFGTIGIIGEVRFITFVKNKLAELFDIKSFFSYDKRHDTRIVSLRIRKKEDIKKLEKLMYYKTNLYLIRKNNKIKTYLL